MQKDHAAVGGDEWLGQTGRSWAEQWRRTDRSFSVLTERLLRRTREFAFGSALDIGCGAGELSLAIGRGRPHCRVIGVDISPRMVDLARELVPDARFETYRREFGDRFEAIELNDEDAAPAFIPPHSVLTLHLKEDGPTKAAEQRVIAFFRERTGAGG